jgi:hypothetical protein
MLKRIRAVAVIHDGYCLEPAQEVNPLLREWITYYGTYHRSLLYPIPRQIDQYFVQRGTRKFLMKGRYFKCDKSWLEKTAHDQPKLVVPWQFGTTFPAE